MQGRAVTALPQVGGAFAVVDEGADAGRAALLERMHDQLERADAAGKGEHRRRAGRGVGGGSSFVFGGVFMPERSCGRHDADSKPARRVLSPGRKVAEAELRERLVKVKRRNWRKPAVPGLPLPLEERRVG